MGDSKDDDFSKWAAQMNKSHGYGGIFNAETDQEKAIVETMTAEEWCQAVAAEEGVSFGALRHNENDPPDIFVEFGSWTLGVELVQLIDEDQKRRASSGSRRKTKQSSPQSVDESPYAGALFIDMQWSRDRFDNKLNEIIQKRRKDTRKTGSGSMFL